MYTSVKGIYPTMMQEMFRFPSSGRYNLRSFHLIIFEIPFKNSVYNGTATYLKPNVWEVVPDNLKKINSLTSFKEQIKKWNPKIANVNYVKPTFSMLLL